MKLAPVLRSSAVSAGRELRALLTDQQTDQQTDHQTDQQNDKQNDKHAEWVGGEASGRCVGVGCMAVCAWREEQREDKAQNSHAASRVEGMASGRGFVRGKSGLIFVRRRVEEPHRNAIICKSYVKYQPVRLYLRSLT